MILYFSGTGNSAYVANYIGNQINDEVVNLFEKIRNHDYSTLKSNKPYVFVVPTYAWQIPHIIREWILNTEISGNDNVYYVLTCGDSIGNAGHYGEKICKQKNLRYKGCTDVIMPENYIAMYDAPDEKAATVIVENAASKIQHISKLIQAGEPFPVNKTKLKGRILSGFVNTLFYAFIVSAKKFYTTKDCISCGYCVKVCPMNNIKMVDIKPNWGSKCTHCMACICTCPRNAIEYGKLSLGKPRYYCPK